MKINIATWIDRNAIIYRDKIALKDDRWSFSYTEMAQRVHQLTSTLQSMGVGKGDRVALLLPNSVEMVEVLFAVQGRVHSVRVTTLAEETES